MKVIKAARRPAVASENVARRDSANALMRGFVDGLGSAFAIGASHDASAKPRERRGLKDDWAAIGGDFRRAMASVD